MKNLWLTILSTPFVLGLTFSPAAAAGDAAAGEDFYNKRCKLCHATEAGKNKGGPSMAGIVGRQAGTTDFAKYTGLKGSTVVWDEANLDAYLTDPKKFVGAKSMIVKVKSAEDRANVIAYMKTLK